MTDWKDNEPIYLQLRQRVIDQIISGGLAEGALIPSIRQVAAQHRINPLTVSRAYQLLSDEGLLDKQRGQGMSVAAGARARARQTERQRFLSVEWPEIARRIRSLNIDARALIATLDDGGAPNEPH
ncbi:MAG: GntR family transcriptional regulator [Pseudomonadales bacterium]